MALQQSNAGPSALQRHIIAVTTPSAKPQVVLDEDAYTEKLERIIERDFFPDVPKLQNKLEWLQVRTLQSAKSLCFTCFEWA
jgi:protein DGCR14